MGKNTHNEHGFSVIEVILAGALFVLFSVGITSAILLGLDANRVSGEQTIATQYATEGMDSARSIRNQSYANLVNSTGTGVALSGGVWTFSGSNTTFDKYTRVLTVADVQRDTNGNIVVSGGTTDTDTKKIISTVTWNVNSARSNSVVLTSYLTNWRKVTAITDCSLYCQSVDSYIVGTCRENTVQCTHYGETYEAGGDIYCTGGPSANTCCCK